MENTKLVLALGGNALGKTCREQIDLVKEAAKHIVSLMEAGHQVVITHGNGPQVGMIHNAFAESHYEMPFAECGAMSQGYIGFHLQNCVSYELTRAKLPPKVCTILTQVQISLDDPAFQNPTKPIGLFYTQEEAEQLKAEKGWEMIEDSQRGFRRVVPSPKPIRIIESASIDELLASDHTVIASGGGGIPVFAVPDEPGNYRGVEAVVDKDFSAALLAKQVNADMLIILTAVDHVAINFGKPNQQNLEQVTVSELLAYEKENQFAKGSMLPKVQAAIQFVKERPSNKALICALSQAKDALAGKTGTLIVND